MNVYELYVTRDDSARYGERAEMEDVTSRHSCVIDKVARKGEPVRQPMATAPNLFPAPCGRLERRVAPWDLITSAEMLRCRLPIMKAQGARCQGATSVKDTEKIILAANLNSDELHESLQM